MRMKELLQTCKLKYPIGTKFKECNGSNNIYTVKAFDEKNTNSWNTSSYIIVHVEEMIGCGKYLYNNSIFSEIMSKPNQNNYYFY
jgi:hypothetical protein